MNEKLKVFLWCMLHYPEYKFKSWLTRKEKARLHIYTSEETLSAIAESKLSVARYGDGELQMISHYLQGGNKDNFEVDTFQGYDAELGKRLLEILKTPRENLLLCLPYQLKNPGISDLYGNLFWEREWLARKDFLSKTVLDIQLGDTNFTRFYMGRRDIKDYPAYIRQMKGLWAGKQIVMVEGQFSRLGVGNDLFDGAVGLKRIICPATNAFAHYDTIIETVERLVTKDTLLLLALGHTATVLAHDLHLKGYQAIDVGHVDVEYEWYRMQAKGKVAVPGKYVNEVASGRISEVSELDSKHESEIIARIQ